MKPEIMNPDTSYEVQDRETFVSITVQIGNLKRSDVRVLLRSGEVAVKGPEIDVRAPINFTPHPDKTWASVKNGVLDIVLQR